MLILTSLMIGRLTVANERFRRPSSILRSGGRWKPSATEPVRRRGR